MKGAEVLVPEAWLRGCEGAEELFLIRPVATFSKKHSCVAKSMPRSVEGCLHAQTLLEGAEAQKLLRRSQPRSRSRSRDSEKSRPPTHCAVA